MSNITNSSELFLNGSNPFISSEVNSPSMPVFESQLEKMNEANSTCENMFETPVCSPFSCFGDDDDDDYCISIQSKSFIQEDFLFSPPTSYALSDVTPPKNMFSSPVEYHLKTNVASKFESIANDKGSTHFRISGKSAAAQVKVMTPLSSIGMMGPPQNLPLKHELSTVETGNMSFIDSPATSHNSSGYMFDYTSINSQPNFASTPVIMSKLLQGQQHSLSQVKMVRFYSCGTDTRLCCPQSVPTRQSINNMIITFKNY